MEAFTSMNHQFALAGGRGDASEAVVPTIRTSPNIDYHGFVKEEIKRELLGTCRSIFNGRNEDFELVPIEANASGKACLVCGERFPALLIKDGENGLIHHGSTEGMQGTVKCFEADGIKHDPTRSVDQYRTDAFTEGLRTVITDHYREFSLTGD
jgi:glycosyltransferase involved in cell wall biosynthesis